MATREIVNQDLEKVKVLCEKILGGSYDEIERMGE